ncbi:hypothetical protein E2C01_101544 [Portunus trituberculatus]|uniref:Uncharacterized protein n=1 Tax=Portunus trituberculatus TaxID=210409 RepID=A0A5B7KKP2_PORTR|nr:hypothetical protein [Portunus trituberculatus]
MTCCEAQLPPAIKKHFQGGGSLRRGRSGAGRVLGVHGVYGVNVMRASLHCHGQEPSGSTCYIVIIVK